MKILICGSRGQLGNDCTRLLQRNHEVTAAGRETLDVSKPSDVDMFVGNVAPNIIVNCTAYTQVDKCETEKELSLSVNGKGPENLARSAQKHGCRLIHISTDYVYDGRKKVPAAYVEDDRTGPISYYGRTKLAGEKAITKWSKQYAILRTAWLYGITGNNFLKTMLRLALNDPEKQIKVINDQYGSPTWSYRLAMQIEKIIEAEGQGIYHATAKGYCTWYELAVFFLNEMNVPHGVIPCTTEEYPTPAVRPTNSILANRQLDKEGIDIMHYWKDDVARFVHFHKKQLINEAT